MKKRLSRHTLNMVFVHGAIVFLIGVGCAALQELANVQKPTLEFQRVRFTGMSFETVNLAFDVSIKNPNPLSASLAGFDYNFQINGASFLSGQQPAQLTIAANAESALEIPLTLAFKDLYQTYQTLKNQDSSAYKIDSGLLFDLPILGRTRIPVSHEGHLPLIKLPDVRMGSLKLKNINFSGAELELKLNVNNPNNFNLLMNKLDYNVAINGATWAKGLTQKAMTIREKSESAITIPVSLSFSSMGRTIYNVIMGNEKLNYHLTGSLDANSSIPLLGQVILPIDRSGQIDMLR
ncbi:MAG: LEA type 2 family protein [Candidatus Zhuqueibacterota bacterium]